MSFPVEFDFAQVLIGDGATPEVFTILCGIEDVSVNQSAETSDRYRRDCEKPGTVPSRKVVVTGRKWDITGNGVASAAMIPTLTANLGIHRNYRVVGGRRDGTDAGETVGTFEGRAVLTSNNLAIGGEGGTGEITLAGDGLLTFTPAP